MNTTEPATPRILVIDDSPASIHLIARALASEFAAEFALSGAEALTRLATGELPDLIVLDLMMPEMNGEEVLHRLKSELRTHDIPVIVITASNDPASETGALLAGAADFIHKPVNPQVVRLRVGLHILLRERERTLCRLNEEIKSLAFYDPLTGLPNRRLLMDRLQNPPTHGVRREESGALLFIDLDDFKALNDIAGHATGDLLLQQVARRLTDCVRKSDTVARLGGDEFVVVLTNLSGARGISTAQARIVGQKILAALNQPYQLDGHEHRSTASIGIVLFDHGEVSVAELLKGADLAMYRTKAAGRNALRVLDPVTPIADRT
ncbi:diguanylate cyclase [uncultured Thiodictyon sp.]|uniref:diguanylate cyclase domain-containing protein n=1 Tax=uncultured Thiodictyon sp. TaxID=1846217 RepID=UPI0025CF7F2A|nr:diguanylate cyclase [uncultured Thiodictyon sp.]